MDKPENPQAFPGGECWPSWKPGMTLLDYFAGQALVWMLADNAPPIAGMGSDSANMIAQESYAVAEAMLIERQKRNKK